MNILKRELRSGLKAFIIWAAVLFVLVYIGIMKFEGVSAGGSSMTDLLSKFPRVVLAVFGVVGVDVGTLSGYTAILSYYVMICAVIYAVQLGFSAVSRESVDKTYEFVFTKPLTRSYILAMKLTAGWIYLTLFCILNAIFSISAAASLQPDTAVVTEIILFTISIFLIGSLFLALSAFMSAISKQPEKGSFYGTLSFLYAFIAGVVFDMLESGSLLKLFSPFKYFSAQDLERGSFDPVYAVITALLISLFLMGTFRKFSKKDMI